MSMYETERSVKDFLDEGSMRYLHKKESHSFIMNLDMGKNVSDCMMAITAHDEEDLSCHIVYEDNVPEHARRSVVEYITRANYGLFLGNFQMDMDDGQLVYQVGTVHSDHIVSKEEIARMIHTAGDMARRYGKGIHDVIDGVCSPEEAVEEAERSYDLFGDADGEEPGSEHSGESEDDYRGIIASMTEEQLDHLTEAVGQALADCVGAKREAGYIPEEYAAVVADLSRGELLKLSLNLLKERFGRMSLDRKAEEEERDDEMSEEEMRRRAAVSSLKARLREKLTGSDREAG